MRWGAGSVILDLTNERLPTVDCGNPGEREPVTSAEVPPADLDVPVLGQLPPAQLPLGDALEPGPLEVVSLDAPLGRELLHSYNPRTA